MNKSSVREIRNLCTQLLADPRVPNAHVVNISRIIDIANGDRTSDTLDEIRGIISEASIGEDVKIRRIVDVLEEVKQ